jgi:hypothetical protein
MAKRLRSRAPEAADRNHGSGAGRPAGAQDGEPLDAPSGVSPAPTPRFPDGRALRTSRGGAQPPASEKEEQEECNAAPSRGNRRGI